MTVGPYKKIYNYNNINKTYVGMPFIALIFMPFDKYVQRTYI